MAFESSRDLLRLARAELDCVRGDARLATLEIEERDADDPHLRAEPHFMRASRICRRRYGVAPRAHADEGDAAIMSLAPDSRTR